MILTPDNWFGASAPVLPAQTALLVVGVETPLSAADTALVALLEGEGWTVNIVDDDNDPYDYIGTGSSVVVISESVGAGTVNTLMTNEAIGLVVIEPALTDDTEISVSAGFNVTPAPNSIVILDNTHTITSSFSPGSLVILSTSRQISNVIKSETGPGADILAESPVSSLNATLVAYETGAEMDSSLMAPARRVFLPIKQFSPDLNANGITLLNRACLWAAEII